VVVLILRALIFIELREPTLNPNVLIRPLFEILPVFVVRSVVIPDPVCVILLLNVAVEPTSKCSRI
jgi:hypothetical protein